MRSRLLPKLSALAVALLFAGMIAPTSMAPTAQHGNTPKWTTQAQSANEQRESVRYWTPKNMAAARPMPSTEQEITASPHSASSNYLASPSHAMTAGPSMVAAHPAASKWTAPGALPNTVGMVLFSAGRRSDMRCSGSTIVDETGNKDRVVSAGHCCKEPGGAFDSHWVFLPGHNSNSEAPLGAWPARQLFTTTAWGLHGDHHGDVCVAVLGTRNGQHIADVVGANLVSFNAPVGIPVHLFGYPGEMGDGETLYYCSGATWTAERRDVGIDCTMKNGSSGGPCLADFNGDYGTVVCVISHGPSRNSPEEIGPRFDASIKVVFDAAGAA